MNKPDPRVVFYLPIFRTEGETNDCVVRAATLATENPYPFVHSVFERHGRKFGKGTPTKVSVDAMAELGWRMVAIPMHFTHSWVPGHEYYDRRAGFHKWRDSHHNCVRRTGMTVAQFLKKHRFGRFVVFVSGHAFAVINGKIYDTADRARPRRYVESYFIPAQEKA